MIGAAAILTSGGRVYLSSDLGAGVCVTSGLGVGVVVGDRSPAPNVSVPTLRPARCSAPKSLSQLPITAFNNTPTKPITATMIVILDPSLIDNV